MAAFENLFKWDEGEAKVFFDIDTTQHHPEPINIRIEKSSSDIELPEFPMIVENADGKKIFRADRLNKEQGHSFEYFDNKYSREIIAFIKKMLGTHRP
ncbi:hypothetical protein [Pollutibacter soli]|uniref:hypothetical protein n=1 Tax=Pollutibacter soli TaxID=3034157 RepID=UPI003013A94E